ncbi:MFS transporter [Malikia sp.]|uniref:MFS transporter n=1 Tax=Malikia sp. TaxID=2070706 RepID=UPI0026245C90|nr:MFS transporter [Malikia sp.]MDD2729450.1 MFS transporter [Malikia sp.]
MSRPLVASRPVIWLIGFFAFVNVYSMQSVLPLLMAEFDATPVQAGLTVGATILAVALLSPFMGMLSDAWGRKGIICGSLFAMALPTALIPLADSLPQIIGLRFLQGLAVPGIVVVVLAYVGEEFQASGGVARMISTYVAGSVMGGFSGRFIAGYAAHWFGWQGAFVALASLNLVGALLVLWRLPRSRHFVPSRDLRSALAVLRSHLSNPRLLAACAVGFCVLFSLVGSFTYVNLYLAGAPFRLSPAGLANVFTVYLLGVLVTPVAGRLMQRHGFLRVLLIALLLSAAGLLLTLLPWLPAIILGLAICSSAIFVCQASTISFIASQVSQGRSLATGLYNMSYYAGGAVGALVAGLAYEGRGWIGVVSVMLLVQALAALWAALGWRQAQAARP